MTRPRHDGGVSSPTSRPYLACNRCSERGRCLLLATRCLKLAVATNAVDGLCCCLWLAARHGDAAAGEIARLARAVLCRLYALVKRAPVCLLFTAQSEASGKGDERKGGWGKEATSSGLPRKRDREALVL